jgi:hypothetical protein
MKSLMQVNPEHVQTRDQTMRVVTAAVAGPALLVAGYRYPGTFQAKAVLMGLGAALIYANFSTFREVFDGEEESEEPEEEDVLLGLGLTS